MTISVDAHVAINIVSPDLYILLLYTAKYNKNIEVHEYFCFYNFTNLTIHIAIFEMLLILIQQNIAVLSINVINNIVYRNSQYFYYLSKISLILIAPNSRDVLILLPGQFYFYELVHRQLESPALYFILSRTSKISPTIGANTNVILQG